MDSPPDLAQPAAGRFAGLIASRERRWGVIVRLGVLEVTSEEVTLRGSDGEPLLQCAPSELRVRRVWPSSLRLEHGGRAWFVQGYVARRDPAREPAAAVELARRFDALRLPPPLGELTGSPSPVGRR